MGQSGKLPKLYHPSERWGGAVLVQTDPLQHLLLKSHPHPIHSTFFFFLMAHFWSILCIRILCFGRVGFIFFILFVNARIRFVCH